MCHQINSNMNLEMLAEKLNGKIWEKGNLKRLYLNNVGYNTKKMKTTAYVYVNEAGSFDVSVYIDCPSQHPSWIKSEREGLENVIYNKIDRVLNPEKYENED